MVTSSAPIVGESRRTRPPLRRRVLAGLGIAAVVASALVAVPALADSCGVSTMYVAAHADDTLLFMSPDLVHDVRSTGACVTSVFVTAGDANQGQTYWSGREDGVKAGYAAMLGVPSTWNDGTETLAGHQLHVSTLASDPAISLVFLRLPEGQGSAGDGGPLYGYQSIKKLWQGTLSQVTTVDGGATYSKQDLIDTLGALMSAAQPTRIGTQDYVDQVGGVDNPDHYVTAYFTQVASQAYQTPHQLVSYQGYGTQYLAANVSGDDLAAKTAAFYAYVPHDPKECQSPQKCASRPESLWLPRQYVVATEDDPAGSTPTPTPTPTPSPTDPPSQGDPVNVARVATATAVSSDGSQTPDKAIDGVAAGYPDSPLNEWSSLKGKAGAWIQLTWASPQNLSKVVLYDRPNLIDQATGGTLVFSDGSTVPVGALPNDGSPLTVTFPARSVTSVRFVVTSVLSGTLNVGLSEFEAWGSSATSAPPTASAGPDQQVASGSGVTLDGSATSPGSDGGTVTYQWTQVSGTAVSLSSASAVSPTFVAPTGPVTLVFQLTASGAAGSTSDQVAISVAAPPAPPSGPSANVASSATVTASSQDTADGQGAINAVDGVAAGYPASPGNEWSTVKGKAGSWIQLTWSSPQTLAKVVLYDRPNLVDQATGGTLAFSDGSTVTVGALPNDGSPLTVTFAPRTVTSVRFTVTSVLAGTANVGLAELEAWTSGTSAGDLPTASAGPDQQVGSGASVTVTGAASTPGSGGALTYAWSQVSGPAVSLSSASALSPSFTAPTGPATLTFRLTVSNSAGSASDDVSVVVAAPPAQTTSVNVAASASATASSSDGAQTPDKAIDGVAAGYPTAPLNEWSSLKGKAGTWIQLTWSSPQTLTKVVLYDRPNLTDQATGGTLTFSDGSSVSVGALPNDGSPLTVTFSARTVTSVRFTVTSVLKGTANVGLAELEAWTP